MLSAEETESEYVYLEQKRGMTLLGTYSMRASDDDGVCYHERSREHFSRNIQPVFEPAIEWLFNLNRSRIENQSEAKEKNDREASGHQFY